MYIGEPIGKQGQQRIALWVQFLHQEERLSRSVGINQDLIEFRFETQKHLNPNFGDIHIFAQSPINIDA